LRGVATHASLQRVLDHYANNDWRAECAIITGDLIQDDSAAAYDRFRELLSPLNMRMHCVPGNHDIREFMRKVCCAPPFSYCAFEEIRDWLIIGLDSCVTEGAGGHVEIGELERLSDVVSHSAAKHVMVCLHHPPVAMGSTWLDTVGMKNGEEFLQHLESLQKVRLAVFGHVHQAYDAEHNGVRVMATPSTCRQFLPASNDFAVDDRPPAYRRISLLANGDCETEIIWIDDE